ncbi:MAG: SBBP repeat-containing protein, partial [Candidatus Thorarchaeota archaeon]
MTSTRHSRMNLIRFSLGIGVLLFLFAYPIVASAHSTTGGSNIPSNCENVYASEYAPELFGQFVENCGQMKDSSIHFYAKVPGGFVGLGTDRITYWDNSMTQSDLIVFDDNIESIPIGLEQVNHITNYYLGDRGTFTNIRSYASIYYEEFSQGIDLILTDPDLGVVCEFRMDKSNDDENLESILEEFGSFKNSDSDTDTRVIRHILIDETISQLQMQQAEDPFLSMYIGGSDREEARAVARDSSGNLYLAGFTSSLNFPVVNNISSYRGARDVFVTMLDSEGVMVYSTYIGGSWNSLDSTPADDEAADIVVDSDGNVYFTGVTQSDDYPTLNPLYSVAQNSSILRGRYLDYMGDVFLTKLDATGTLNYSTYLGGSMGETGTSVALDGNGNIYVGGLTTSDDFPLENPFDSQTGMTSEGFITCISAAEDEILFSSFLGGSQSDSVNDIIIDNAGNIIITGYSMGGIALTSPLDSIHGGGNDVFVFKLDASWSVVYSTYLGGSGGEIGYSISTDATG